MGSSSEGGTDLRKPQFFKNEMRDLYKGGPRNAQDLLAQGDRIRLPGQTRGDLARQFGMGHDALRTAMATGVTPFTADQNAAFAAGRNFSGPNFGGSLDRLGNSIDAMNNFRVDPGVNQTAQALRNFQQGGDARRSLGDLEGFQGSQGAQDAVRDVRGFAERYAEPGQGENFLTETASGQFLDRNNPYLEADIEAQQRNIQRNFGGIAAQVGSQFLGAGSFNNSMRATALGEQAELANQQLADIETSRRSAEYGRERGFMEDARTALAGLQSEQRGQNLQAGIAGMQGAIGLSEQELAAQTAAAQGYITGDQQRLAGMQAGGQLFLGGSQLQQQALADALAGSATFGQLRTDQAMATSQAELQRIAMLSQFGGMQQAQMAALAGRGAALRGQQMDDLSWASGILHPGGNLSLNNAEANEQAVATGLATTGAGLGSAFGPVGAVAGGIIGYGGGRALS